LNEVEEKYSAREEGRQKLNVLEELNQLLIDAHISDLSSFTPHTLQTLIVGMEQYEDDLRSKMELLENKV
jgi:hypothetical protein